MSTGNITVLAGTTKGAFLVSGGSDRSVWRSVDGGRREVPVREISAKIG